MKRLTEYTIPETGFSVVSEEKYKRILMEEKPSVEKVYNRLKKIEDILGDEYDLERFRELVKAYREERYIVLKEPRQADVHRLSELAQADREGRCVVIPFKPPRWVYMCSERFPKPGEAYYASTINVLQDMEKGCVFGDTPEEAQAALRREQE